jgi:formate-dependent nitrite reductase membrane component NrfD
MTTGSARYEQLIQDLKADFRPQREWVERQGLFLIIGHFLSGVAAGTWLFSLVLNFPTGLVVSFALALISGLAHLAFLGRPERFWKMWHARNSWIARGFIGLTLFIIGALLYLPPILYADSLWDSASPIARTGYVLTMAGMIILLLYKGFVYASSKGVPFWTSPILPALYVAYALRGGVAMLLIIVLLRGNSLDGWDLGLLELWIGISAAVMILFYLAVMSGSNPVARRSVQELLGGRVALSFYGGTLAIGLVVPITIGLLGLTTPLSFGAIAAVGIASVIGDFFVKYTIAKAGLYMPLRPQVTRAIRDGSAGSLYR